MPGFLLSLSLFAFAGVAQTADAPPSDDATRVIQACGQPKSDTQVPSEAIPGTFNRLLEYKAVTLRFVMTPANGWSYFDGARYAKRLSRAEVQRRLPCMPKR